jgi:hypothetical protein
MGTVFLYADTCTHEVKKGRGRLVKLLLSHWTLLREVCQTLHLMELFVKLLFVSELICLSVLMLLIYPLTVIGLTPGGSSTLHIYTQTVQRTTK